MTFHPHNLYRQALDYLDEGVDIADGLGIALVEAGWTLPGVDDDTELLAGELRGRLQGGYGWDEEGPVVRWLRLHDEDFIHTEAYNDETPLTDPRIP